MRNAMPRINTVQTLTLFAFIFLYPFFSLAQGSNHVYHMNPKAGSVYNSIYTNIHFSLSAQVTDENVQGKFKITTEQNTTIFFKSYLFYNGKFLVLDPLGKLPNHQKIKVTLTERLQLSGGLWVEPFSYTFTTNTSDSIEGLKMKAMAGDRTAAANLLPIALETKKAIYTTTSITPDETPQVMLGKKTNPSPGQIMLTTLTISGGQQTNYLLIVDNDGRKLYSKTLPDWALDFKKLSDSTYSYFHNYDLCYYILDKHLNPIDTVRAQNGYITDAHDLVIDRFGNYYIMANQYVVVDMTNQVTGGNPQALVMGIVVQKLDRAKNVLFEWKSLDYLPILQAVGVSFTANFIDYLHSNSIELDGDSAILLSSRHFNEVEKINTYTGQVIWRMGRNGGNQFAFPNDLGAFSYQHDARRLPNGNIMIFDNGNYRPTTRYSRVVEYKVDEVNKIATKVWEYRHSPDVTSNFMGNAQRLPNGNTMIGWGGTLPTLSEIDSLGNVVLEMQLPGGYYSYRAFKFDLSKLLADNQSKSSLKDTSYFCNQNEATITGNLPFFLSNGTPFDSITEINLKPNNKVFMSFVTPANFFSYDSSLLLFNTSRLMQKDTLLCNPSAGTTLAVSNGCPEAKYRWSTNDSVPQVHVSPSKDSYYWVDIRSGSYVTRDSVKVNVADNKPFDIYGVAALKVPYEIHTYSVPFVPQYSYDWEVINGNIISGFGTNAIEIQWGNKDTGYINISMHRQVCEKTNSTIVLLNGANTGISKTTATQVKVYPNPAQQQLTIETKGDFAAEVYDMTGRKVVTTHGTNNGLVDLSGLPKGVYSVVVKSGDQTDTVRITKL
ncbi:MAG: aryl-sulfate sulfotransferase [Bacteroidia bacterium]|nr:aryl-sulfate sulfotransferase [Bacteroidia bacterium]